MRFIYNVPVVPSDVTSDFVLSYMLKTIFHGFYSILSYMIRHVSSKLYVVICSFILNGPLEVFFSFFLLLLWCLSAA